MAPYARMLRQWTEDTQQSSYATLVVLCSSGWDFVGCGGVAALISNLPEDTKDTIYG